MTENKYTPGPWNAVFHDMGNPDGFDSTRDFYTIRDKRNCYVASVTKVDKLTWNGDQFAANAALIAAAPDLLAACERMAAYLSQLPEVLQPNHRGWDRGVNVKAAYHQARAALKEAQPWPRER